MNLRSSRQKLIQLFFWNTALGRFFTRCYLWFDRRFHTIVLNRSLIADTNGEHWLLDQLPENPTVIDVGFHHGRFSQKVIQLRPKCSIVAFDPSREASGIFHQRFTEEKRINFLPSALGKEQTTVVLHDYANECNSLSARLDGSPDGVCTEYEVEMTTLDKACAEQDISKIDLLKIDAEGHDLDVLRGATQLLSDKKISMLMFEYASGWIFSRHTLAEVHDFFEPLPYRPFRLFNGFLVPFEYDVNHEHPAEGCMFVYLSDQVELPIRTNLCY